MFYRGGAGKRRDGNEKAIRTALEAVGATVWQIGGRGLPDLLVRYRGRWTPLEVKTAKGKMKATQVTEDGASHFPVVRSEDEAMRLIGAIR